MANLSLTSIFAAIAGGVFPTFLWLWFWVRQDVRKEPRVMLVASFLIGSLAVMMAIPLEHALVSLTTFHIEQIAVISFVEEALKFLGVALFFFSTGFIDEPSDYGIYLVTAALGFAALENTLFLMNPLADNNIALTITTGNLRFLGATVLHTVSAGVIGVALGSVFYKNRLTKLITGFTSFLVAVILHGLFNYFMSQGDDVSIITTIALTWLVLVVVVYSFRRLKYIRPPYTYRY